MIILDSNHLHVLRIPGAASERLKQRIITDGRDPCTTIINIHEGIKGWLELINSAKTTDRKVLPYKHLQELIEYYANWIVLPFDEKAAAKFTQLRQNPLIRRIGAMDIQMAAIALCRNFTILSADGHFDTIAKHFPLDVQNWLLEEL